MHDRTSDFESEITDLGLPPAASQSQVRGSPLSLERSHHLLPINALTDFCAPSYPAYYLFPRLRAYSKTLNTLFQDTPVLESAATQRDWPCVSHTCWRYKACMPKRSVRSTHFYMKRTHRLTAIYGQRSSLPASNAIGQLLATSRSAGVLPSFVRQGAQRYIH